jgi:hypothetical protein
MHLKLHLFLSPHHIFCINTIVNFVAGIKALCKHLSMHIQSSNCSPLFPTNSHKTWVLVLEGPHTFKQTTITQEFDFLQQRPEPYNKDTHTPIFFPRITSLTAVDSFFPCCSPQKQSFQHVQKECSTLNIHVPQRYPILTCAQFRIILRESIAL